MNQLLKLAAAHVDALVLERFIARAREQQIGGSGGSLEPPGPLLTHLHTVYMAHSECLPTRLSPLAKRTCFSQARAAAAAEPRARARLSKLCALHGACSPGRVCH